MKEVVIFKFKFRLFSILAITLASTLSAYAHVVDRPEDGTDTDYPWLKAPVRSAADQWKDERRCLEPWVTDVAALRMEVQRLIQEREFVQGRADFWAKQKLRLLGAVAPQHCQVFLESDEQCLVRVFGADEVALLVFLNEKYAVNASYLLPKVKTALPGSPSPGPEGTVINPNHIIPKYELEWLIWSMELIPRHLWPSHVGRNLRFVRNLELCKENTTWIPPSGLYSFEDDLIDYCEPAESQSRTLFIPTFIHEYGHFIGYRGLDPTGMDASQSWLALSGWSQVSDSNSAKKWEIRLPGRMVTDYSRNSPTEDFAETFRIYRLEPTLLKTVSLDKYEWMKWVVFGGADYAEEQSCRQRSIFSAQIQQQLLDRTTVDSVSNDLLTDGAVMERFQACSQKLVWSRIESVVDNLDLWTCFVRTTFDHSLKTVAMSDQRLQLLEPVFDSAYWYSPAQIRQNWIRDHRMQQTPLAATIADQLRRSIEAILDKNWEKMESERLARLRIKDTKQHNKKRRFHRSLWDERSVIAGDQPLVEMAAATSSVQNKQVSFWKGIKKIWNRLTAKKTVTTEPRQEQETVLASSSEWPLASVGPDESWMESLSQLVKITPSSDPSKPLKAVTASTAAPADPCAFYQQQTDTEYNWVAVDLGGYRERYPDGFLQSLREHFYQKCRSSQ